MGNRNQSTATRTIIIIGGIAFVAAFVVGLLIGRYAICSEENNSGEDGTFLPGVPASLIQEGDPEIEQMLIDAVDNKKLEDYLRHLTRNPHVAGSQSNLDLALWMKEIWEDGGFDDVKLTPYDVLLSFPDPDKPNVVRLLNNTGGVVYESPLKEADLKGEDRPDALPPYNAYSPPGLIEGEMVYVNYGRVEDYDWLENNASINVTGKIVIARYGKIFRGSKVSIAENHGAIGVVMFSDPDDYAYDGDPRVYPETWWLPGSGAQRGTIYTKVGDPLTPGYPATKNAYRVKESSPEAGLPKIPAHPIGSNIAGKILREMGGPEAPHDWRGKIPDVTYRLGPQLAKSGWKLQMDISTRNEMRTTYNLIGVIRGQVEPDRYVLIGNHRDAWVYGAIDPSSGTAVMMEVARVMGQLVKSGRWRPRRSIMFCSWGAEEYGLLGSNEWVEEYVKTLRERAVAYINVDLSLEGNHSLIAFGTPLLYRATYEAAKKIPNPNQAEVAAGRKTVYDTWLHTFPWKEGDTNLNIPNIGSLGSGSDYAPLLQKAGITSIDLSYTYDSNKYKIASYPLYHSIYETFYLVKNIMDKEFRVHQAVTRMSAELARSLADSLIIPFNVSDYSWALNTYFKIINDSEGERLKARLENYDDLRSVIANFSAEVDRFNERVSKVNKNDPMAVRAVNDQLMLLEKAFLDSEGLPGRIQKKHLLLAESQADSYAGSSFPGLVDLLFEIDKAEDVEARWELIKRHFSVVVYTIDAAATTLRDVIKFIPQTVFDE